MNLLPELQRQVDNLQSNTKDSKAIIFGRQGGKYYEITHFFMHLKLRP